MDTRVVFLLLAMCCSCSVARNLTFPDGFMFGAATAAYQVEGAWNSSGKGESIWDRLVHTRPECITHQATADVAADSYHKYKEDVKAAKTIGLTTYRFSISWARVLPKGDISLINHEGLGYYDNLINELLANNIQPVVTIFHWDIPQYLQDLGGFSNSIIIDYFEDYARLLFTKFGDRVKWWITFNEPYIFSLGYSTACMAPGVISPAVGQYVATHNLLKAHARAYHVYDSEFRRTQKGKVGITLSADWGEPKSQSQADLEAAERYLQFNLGWFAHPIFSQEGDYPAIMKERIANNSKAEGLRRSRLPEFSEYWVNYIKGTHDFFGLNTYTTYLVGAPNASVASSETSFENDMGNLVTEQSPNWPSEASTFFRYVPFGVRKLLKWISDTYNHVPILITENGWSDFGGINDTMRSRYIVNCLAATLDAVHMDAVNVLGYTVWSLIDTFEWDSGYSIKFGLYSVDYNDTARPRSAKNSSEVYGYVIKNKKLPEEYLDEVNLH